MQDRYLASLGRKASVHVIFSFSSPGLYASECMKLHFSNFEFIRILCFFFSANVAAMTLEEVYI